MARKGMRLVFVFQSMNAPLKPCLKYVGGVSRAEQPARDSAIGFSDEKGSLHAFLPMLFRVFAGITTHYGININLNRFTHTCRYQYTQKFTEVYL